MDVIDFYPDYNIVLMRGAAGSTQLGDRLSVDFQDTPTSAIETLSLARFLLRYPNAQCTFRPSFEGILNTATNEYEGFGVRVNTRTGEVRAGSNPSPLPLETLYNFTIIATLLPDRGIPTTSTRAYPRVHLHNYVAKAWLSPSPMRLPKTVSGFTFSVLAQFDDQTVDLLNGFDVERWSSNPSNKVDNRSGELRLSSGDTDGLTIDVTTRLVSDFRDRSGNRVDATGQAIVYSPTQVAQLVSGSAGYDKRNEVPNFLFIAEGFQDGEDQRKFNAMIDNFIRDLRQSSKFKPFDHLVGHMNFWKIFVPSVTRGVGTRYEVYGGSGPNFVFASSPYFDILNASPATEGDLLNHRWDAEQVQFYFGLPVLWHMERPTADIKRYWQNISYLPNDLIDRVPDNLVEGWRSMGDRRMVNDSDTFLGMYYGAPSKVKVRASEDRSIYSESSQRFNRARLNDFLQHLQYNGSGVPQPIGPLWDWNNDPATHSPIGKDWDNVIILLASDHGRARNRDGELCTNVIRNERHHIDIEADPAVNAGFAEGRAAKMADLPDVQLPEDMPLLPGKTALLHEMCHSLGLEDEYGELGIRRSDPRLIFTGTGNIGNDKHYSNIQVKSDLLVSGSPDVIDADKIKWRWHRIEKSAVLAPISSRGPAAITRAGTQYRIKVKPGQAAAFARDDRIFLRRRKLGESILQDIGYSQISNPRYPFVTRSPELYVDHVEASADVVVVAPSNPGELAGHDLIIDFPAESVLYKPLPVRTPLSVFPSAGNHLELIAANVLNLIDRTGQPVHEKMDSSGTPDLDFDPEQNPNLPGIPSSLCAKKNRNIVALYAGGNTYHHGVYHAAGHCLMRSHHIAELCSVCKYILTDFIDPSLHPQVDALIEEYYPIKANH